MPKASGVVPHLPECADVKWKFNQLTNTGVADDPTKATPEKGRKMREAMVEAVVKIVSALDASDWDCRTPVVVKGR
jgi:creatinine amidohydrolase/Fe(II)-dependent formamide hydrolase-like protein